MTIEREYVPAPKTREDLEFEIEAFEGQIRERKEQLDKLNTEPIRVAARHLLDLCCTDDDPDEAFARAFQILMEVADVSDFPPSETIRVLVAEYGVDRIRDWVTQVNRKIARAR